MIRDAQDVLDALLGPGARARAHRRGGPALDAELADVLDLVERGSEQRRRAGAAPRRLEPGRLAAALVKLELRRLRAVGLRRPVRAHLAGAVTRLVATSLI